MPKSRRTAVQVLVLGLLCAAIAVPWLAGHSATGQAEPAGLRPVRTCDSMHNTPPQMNGVQITSATTLPAAGADPQYCQLDGIIAPAIHFRLKLPITTYLGRYLQYGCGGFCGAILDPKMPSCPQPMAAGFAISSTDDGHLSGSEYDATWAVRNEQARVDFGSRAPHVLALTSKTLLTAFYGTPPTKSYFSGCSDGGREGLLLAQRYPADFDGIAAGSSANFWAPLLAEFQTWVARANLDRSGRAILTADKVPALHRAVLAACDKLDGLADGVIDDPAVCRFDPAAIQCPHGTNNASCLTPAQVGAVRKLYSGPVDSAGSRLYPGGEPYGSEPAWPGWLVGDKGKTPAYRLADNYLRYLAFPNGKPGSSVAKWHFDKPSFTALAAEGVRASAMSTDLSAFHARGGKLLLWHGLADPVVPPAGSIDYYQRTAAAMGGLAQTKQWARLFLIPGMYHCTAGYGTGVFDPVGPLVQWVESGVAPEKLDTRSADQQRYRPVFAYPNRAVYTGAGSSDDAENFIEAGQRPAQGPVKWAGEGLYRR